MGRLGRYPRYIELRKLKTSAGGLDPDYVVSVRSQLRQQWDVQRDVIACELETSTITEFHHWVRALLEAVHDIETGMSAVETALPGLKMLLQQSSTQGRRRRDLYTALLVLSAWEQGYTADASEVSLSTEARLVGLGTRALQELLRRAEPIRTLVARHASAEEPRREDSGEEEVHAIMVAVVTAAQPSAAPKQDLYTALRNRFSQIERLSLLRSLEIDPEDVRLSPETRDDFVWAIIGYAERQNRLAGLWDAIRHKRPHALPSANPFRS
jgi:hypothetical protein